MSCHNYKLLKCNYRNNGVDHFGLLASSYKLWKKSWYTMNYYYLDTKSEVFFKKDRTPTSRYQVLGCKKIFVNENRKWILDRKICFVFSSTYTTYLLITSNISFLITKIYCLAHTSGRTHQVTTRFCRRKSTARASTRFIYLLFFFVTSCLLACLL